MRPFIFAAILAALSTAAAAQPAAKPTPPIEVRALGSFLQVCPDYVDGRPTAGLIQTLERHSFLPDGGAENTDEKGYVFIYATDREYWPVNAVQIEFGPAKDSGRRLCRVKVTNGDAEGARLIKGAIRWATTASPPFTMSTPRFEKEEEYGEKAWITGLSRPGRNLWITEREQPKNRYDGFLFRDIFELVLIEQP